MSYNHSSLKKSEENNHDSVGISRHFIVGQNLKVRSKIFRKLPNIFMFQAYRDILCYLGTFHTLKSQRLPSFAVIFTGLAPAQFSVYQHIFLSSHRPIA